MVRGAACFVARRGDERETIWPRLGDAFSKTEAGLAYSRVDQCFYVSKIFVEQKQSAGAVSYRRLSETDRTICDGTRKKDIDGLVAARALRVMSLE